jgi:hypothetical protein
MSRARLVAALACLPLALLTTALPVRPAAAAVPSLSVSLPGVLGANHPSTVTVAGSGLAQYGGYRLDFDGSPIDTVGTDGNGAFSVSEHLAGATCGDHQLSITLSWVIGFVAVPPAATARYHVLCPSIALTPRSVLRSQLPPSIAVQPNGDFDYAGDDQYKVLLVDGMQVRSVGYHAPISIAPTTACGVHVVRLVQPSQFGAVDAQAGYTVLCPGVAVQPATIDKAAEPAPATVTGSGYDPNAPVTVSVGGQVVAGAVSDGVGDFSVPITLADLDCGPHPLTAVEPGYPAAQAGASVTVRCTHSGPAHSHLALNPDVVATGMTTRVTGSGFQPATQVTLVWHLADGTTEAVGGSPVLADSHGRIDFYTLVLPHGATGGRTMVATDASSSATAQAVVQGGTMQPSGGGSQIVFRR